MRAEVDARKADQTYQRAEQREQRGAKRRTTLQRVDEVEQKTVKRHVGCDVARGKAAGGGIIIDLDNIRRRARPSDDDFDRVGQEPDRSEAYQQASGFDLEPKSEQQRGDAKGHDPLTSEVAQPRDRDHQPMKIAAIEPLNESSDPQVSEDKGHAGDHAGDHAERQKRVYSDFPQMIFLDNDTGLCSVPYRSDRESLSMITPVITPNGMTRRRKSHRRAGLTEA